MALLAQGSKSGPFRETIDADRLRRFADAIGARESDPAPPTFLTAFRRGEFDLLQKGGIQLKHVLHGEQEYQYASPLRAGDTLEYETTLASLHEKRGGSGKMTFLVFETTFRAEGRDVGLSRTTILHREAAAT